MTRRVLERLILVLACAMAVPLGACVLAPPPRLAEPARAPVQPDVPLANPLILGVQ